MNIAYLISRCKVLVKESTQKPKKLGNYLGGSIRSTEDFTRIFPALYAIYINGLKNKRAETLKKNLFEYICQAEHLLDDVNCEKEVIDLIISNEILPHYGEFHRSRSREISFLPLPLRLYIYHQMFSTQKTDTGKIEVLDRISITLAKMQQFERAQMAEAIKLFYLPKSQERLDIFYAQCQELDKLYENRKEFFLKKNLDEASLIDELKLGLHAFSDIANFNEISIAPSILKLLEAYFPALSQEREYIDAALYYVNTGDRSQLDTLQIEPTTYAEQIIQKTILNQNNRYEGSIKTTKPVIKSDTTQQSRENFIRPFVPMPQIQKTILNQNNRYEGSIKTTKPIIKSDTTQQSRENFTRPFVPMPQTVLEYGQLAKASNKQILQWVHNYDPTIYELRAPLENVNLFKSHGLYEEQDAKFEHLEYVEGQILEGYLDRVANKFIIRYWLNNSADWLPYTKEDLVKILIYCFRCLSSGKPFMVMTNDKIVANFRNPMQIESIVNDICYLIQTMD